MKINKQMKMADLILLNYQLLPVINRFGIELGFGEKTVEQVCKAQKIDINFFLEIINAFHNADYLPEEHLQNSSISLIIKYLKKSHDFFINVKLNSIEDMLKDFVSRTDSQQIQKIALIENFFAEYKKELITHINHENNVVYPYILQLYKATTTQNKHDFELAQKFNYSIVEYATEHSDVEEKLYDLKNIIIKYIPKTSETDLCNHILFDLFELEKDLLNHQRIEEKVLIPKAIKIEQETVLSFKL